MADAVSGHGDMVHYDCMLPVVVVAVIAIRVVVIAVAVVVERCDGCP